jgi:hypothetical protein
MRPRERKLREATFHHFCRLILRLLYPGCCLGFAGSVDYESRAKDLQQVVKTKKTELLFLALFLRPLLGSSEHGSFF